MPMAVSKFFLIQTLTCDLFEVATFLLLRHLIQTDTEPNYRLLWFSDEQWYLKHRWHCDGKAARICHTTCTAGDLRQTHTGLYTHNCSTFIIHRSAQLIKETFWNCWN